MPPRLTFPRPYNAAAALVDRHLVEGRGARVAFRDDRTQLTYAELAERVGRAGNALAALGVQMEQRVMLAMLDCVELPVLFLGAIRLGAVAVPVNTLLAPDDYVHLARDSRARVLVVSDALLPKLEKAVAAASMRVIPVSALAPLLAAASPELAPAPTTADDVAFWLYSSGSTGLPKAAMHLHGHLAWTAALYGGPVLGLREDDVVFSAAKLFFAYGLGNSLTFPLTVGATAILRSDRATPATVMRVFAEERPTIFCAVPTLYAALLAQGAHPPEGSRLRLSVSAGEALPRHVGESWRARFGSDILDGIGSTELLHIFLSNRSGDVRYGTTGKPVAGYDLELRGDDGRPVSDGEEGSLWVRGPTAAAGYFNDRARSLETFHGPWTRTGDRYVRDGDGYYTYSGRTDDMLKVSGQWVAPFEVESALVAHDAVLEAAVVGHADADGLIKPRAFVVLKDPARADEALGDELKAFVKASLLPHKYPRWIEFVRELPKTATGKIQRFRLR
jgi:benzoate-CoA ligase family protein